MMKSFIEQFNKTKVLNCIKLINNNAKKQANGFNNDRCFPLFTTFNPRLSNVFKFINNHKNMLTLDFDLSSLIQPDKVFASFRGCTTISDNLDYKPRKMLLHAL